MRFSRIAAVSSLAVVVSAASAQVVFQTGFEPPAYTADSSIVGQPASMPPTWTTFSGGFIVRQAVPSVTPFAGSQMLESTSHAAPDTERNARIPLLDAWNSRNAGNNIAVASVMMYLPSASTTQEAQYGIRARSASGATSQFAGIFADITTGVVSMWAPTGNTVTNLTLSKDAWHHVELEMNFDTGLVRGFVNGSMANHTFSFEPAVTTQLFWVTMWNQKPATHEIPQVVYFDDYKIQAVPEPATMAALGLGLLALARKRKAQG
jgi:hypothetical protein